jgi:hypothetical protein
LVLAVILVLHLWPDIGPGLSAREPAGITLWLWIASMVIFALTSLRPLRFVGEADRYLDYLGFAPATALLSLWLLEAPGGQAAGVLAAVIAAMLFVAKEGPPLAQVDDRALSEACAFLSSSTSAGARVLTVPMSLGFEVHYKTGRACFVPLPLDETASDLVLRYPIPLMDLALMQSRFQVTHLLTSTDMERREAEVGAAVAPLTPEFENGRYRVYALSRVAVRGNLAAMAVNGA